MDNNELLQAIEAMMDRKLQPIKEDISHLKDDVAYLKGDVAEIKEDSAITRTSVNKLLEWADDASIQVIPLFNKRKAD